MTFVGMLDPPRPGNVRLRVLRVIVITRDNKETAESICRKIGIFGDDENLTGKSYTGREFDELSIEKKIETVRRASLFSRTEPAHKSQLVDLLKGQGEVAMVREESNSLARISIYDVDKVSCFNLPLSETVKYRQVMV